MPSRRANRDEALTSFLRQEFLPAFAASMASLDERVALDLGDDVIGGEEDPPFADGTSHAVNLPRP